MLIKRLEQQSGLSRTKLMRLAETASKRYKLYEIEKRSGQGTRLIAHPSRELKAVQRWLNINLIRLFDVHGAAMAYRRGSGIAANAARHAASSFTVRMDFKDFFPSFEADGISRFLKRENERIAVGLNDDDIVFACLIMCRYGQLTIGAPTSPAITNAMMFDFDGLIGNFADSRGLIYTRYADDVFVSAGRAHALNEVPDAIRQAAKAFGFARLTLNEKKTAFLSRKFHRSVTGLIITPDHRVSLGRDRKRMIKSLVHSFSRNELDVEAVTRLQGLVAFAMDCDRAFFEALTAKYGRREVDRLMTS